MNLQISVSASKITDAQEFEDLIRKDKAAAKRMVKKLSGPEKARMVEDVNNWNSNRAVSLAVFFLENGK